LVDDRKALMDSQLLRNSLLVQSHGKGMV
jgi:hypothetical protein